MLCFKGSDVGCCCGCGFVWHWPSLYCGQLAPGGGLCCQHQRVPGQGYFYWCWLASEQSLSDQGRVKTPASCQTSLTCLVRHQRRRQIKTVIKARLKHIRAQGNMCFQRRARSRFAIRYVSPRVRAGAMWGTGIFYWAFGFWRLYWGCVQWEGRLVTLWPIRSESDCWVWHCEGMRVQYSDEGPRLPWSGLSTVATPGLGPVITRRSAPPEVTRQSGVWCGVIGEITWTNGNPSPISVSALLMLVRKDTCRLKHQIQRTLIRIIYLIWSRWSPSPQSSRGLTSSCQPLCTHESVMVYSRVSPGESWQHMGVW